MGIMTDFTIPYRSIPQANPFQNVNHGVNAILSVQAMNDRKKRTDIFQQEADERKRSRELLEVEIPFKWAKQKLSMVGDIAGQISKLPEPEMASRYKDLIEKVVPMPLVKDSPLGPLGVVDSSRFLPYEDFVKLDSKGKKDYIGTLYKTSDDLVKFELEDYKNEQKMKQYETEYTNKVDLISKESAARLKQIGAMNAGDIDLEKLRQKGDRELEELKRKGKAEETDDDFIVKAADNAPFYKAASTLFDVELLANGEYRIGGSKDEAKKALGIIGRAQTIYKENKGRLTHTEAFNKAANEFGENIPGSPGLGGAARNSWKNYLNVAPHRQDNTR
jgi:hypothetical protein